MPQLAAVSFGAPVRYNRPDHTVYGDTWACAWAPDGTLYTVMDDTTGFNMGLSPSQGRNVALGSFEDTAPPALAGVNVTGLEAYGRSGQLGADGACWKGNGMISVDGLLYLSVSRHWYHVKEYDSRQYSRDASIVKSDNDGRTFGPEPYLAEPMCAPLFPGPRFATPFFVDFGQDGAEADAAGGCVYAVSTDGYWDNGNALHLARTLRSDLPNLSLDTWEFYCGTRRGSTEPIWRPGRPGLDACYPILSEPFGFGQTGMTYIAQTGRFLLIGWNYPLLTRDQMQNKTSVWNVYDSPTPWGPWNHVAAHTWETEGLYNPCLPSKFISPDGCSLWALTCGDFWTGNQSPDETLYTLLQVPVTLEWA